MSANLCNMYDMHILDLTLQSIAIFALVLVAIIVVCSQYV